MKKILSLSNKYKTTTIFFLLLILLVCVFVFIFKFSNDISSNQNIVGTQRLYEASSTHVSYINDMFTGYIDYTDSLATMLSSMGDIKSQAAKDLLMVMSKGTKIDKLSITYIDGTSYSNNNNINITYPDEYLERIKDGKPFLTELLTDKNNEKYISIASPIIKNGKIIGAVYGTFNAKQLLRMIDKNLINAKWHFQIINNKGTIYAMHKNDVISDGKQNYFNIIEQYNFDKNYSKEQIIEDINKKQSNITAYTVNNEKQYSYFMPIGIADLVLVTSTSQITIDKNIKIIQSKGIVLIVEITFILLFMFFILYYLIKKSKDEVIKANKQFEFMNAAIPGGIITTTCDDSLTILYANKGYYNLVGFSRSDLINKFHNFSVSLIQPEMISTFMDEIKTQLSLSDTFNVKTKILHKKTGFFWAHVTGKKYILPDNSEKIYMVIVDISEHVNTMEMLLKEQEFNSLIVSLTDDGFFDCDILNETIRYSKNFANRLGIDEFSHNYPKTILEKGIIAEDSKKYFIDRFHTNRQDVIEEEIHFILPNQESVWYLFRYNVIHDNLGIPTRAIGKMTDITKHKNKITELSHKAQRDPLTGFYNKTTTEILIKDALIECKGATCALIIIDIDNFKGVNDNLGHLYGDTTLSNLAKRLKPLFRTNDIIGRIGGDEFFVFLKNLNSLDAVKTKAMQINDLFNNSYCENEVECNISASIGISLYPEHGTDFDTLYINADKALYITKERGKNNYNIFDGTVGNGYKSNRTQIEG